MKIVLVILSLAIIVYGLFIVARAYYLWQIDQESKDE